MPKPVILQPLPPPGEDVRSCGPGPLSMADLEMVTKQLEIAGYDDIRFERVDAPLMVGNSLDDAVDFQPAIGPTGEVYRGAGDEAKAKHEEIIAALKSELSKHVTDDGAVMESSSWKIHARNPRSSLLLCWLPEPSDGYLGIVPNGFRGNRSLLRLRVCSVEVFPALFAHDEEPCRRCFSSPEVRAVVHERLFSSLLEKEILVLHGTAKAVSVSVPIQSRLF